MAQRQDEDIWKLPAWRCIELLKTGEVRGGLLLRDAADADAAIADAARRVDDAPTAFSKTTHRYPPLPITIITTVEAH